jgi:hypothetical protein
MTISMSAWPRHVPGGIGKRSLPMVWPFTIGKAFGLAAATRPRNSCEARTYGKKTGLCVIMGVRTA